MSEALMVEALMVEGKRPLRVFPLEVFASSRAGSGFVIIRREESGDRARRAKCTPRDLGEFLNAHRRARAAGDPQQQPEDKTMSDENQDFEGFWEMTQRSLPTEPRALALALWVLWKGPHTKAATDTKEETYIVSRMVPMCVASEFIGFSTEYLGVDSKWHDRRDHALEVPCMTRAMELAREFGGVWSLKDLPRESHEAAVVREHRSLLERVGIE